MHIIVCVKQVPEVPEINWDPEKGTLIRAGSEGTLNPTDRHALEAGLRLREDHGGSVTAVSMGPPQAEESLMECLSMGVDEAILLSDEAFAGADTLSTSYTLSLAIKRFPGFDIILCGKESRDGMTGQVGPQLAELLNIPQLTYATGIQIESQVVTIGQKLGGSLRTLKAPLPALITVEREINEPRIPAMDSIMEAYRAKRVTVWGSEELGGERSFFGLKGSPTQCSRVYTGEIEKRNITMLDGEPDEVAGKLIELLQKRDLL